MHLIGPKYNMQSLAPNRCTANFYGSHLDVLGTTWWSDSGCFYLPEVPFIDLFWKADDIHNRLGGSWYSLSGTCIWRRRSTMVKSSWQHPWIDGRDFFLTWWKAGGDKYGGWKDGGWMCGVLGLPMLLYDGRSIHIGSGKFHCGDLTGCFCGAGVERWDC